MSWLIHAGFPCHILLLPPPLVLLLHLITNMNNRWPLSLLSLSLSGGAISIASAVYVFLLDLTFYLLAGKMPLLLVGIELGPVGDGLGVSRVRILQGLVEDLQFRLDAVPRRFALDADAPGHNARASAGIRTKAVGPIALTVLTIGIILVLLLGGLDVLPRVALAPRGGEAVVRGDEVRDVGAVGAEAGGHAAAPAGALGGQFAHAGRAAAAAVLVLGCNEKEGGNESLG